MCLACQMEDELWFAYLDQVARQEKQAAADAPAKVASEAEAKPAANPAPKPAPSSPFACEELPPE